MRTFIYLKTLAAAFAMGGTLYAEDAPATSVQVSVGKPEVTISETKTASGPVTWLGLAAEQAPGDVVAQLPDGQGCGLVVRYVSKDSPAEKAGVQVNDVLTHFADQILVHPDQLKFLVGSHKAGDTVQLTAYRHGKEVSFSAQLESKTLPPEEAIRIGGAGQQGKGWNAVSSLSPDIQRAIREAMSGKSPVSISGSVTVTGPDGKQISSNALPDMNTVSQILKLASGFVPSSNASGDANASASPSDPAALLKLLQEQLRNQSRAESKDGSTPAPGK